MHHSHRNGERLQLLQLTSSHTLGASDVQVCYGMMWPTLGGGIMLAVTPSPEEMAQVGSSTCCSTGSIAVAQQGSVDAACLLCMLGAVSFYSSDGC
jgi:hypothetical protein